MSAKPAVLLIGGVDPQGCAGLTADIQTVSHHDCHPVPLVTALTEQRSDGLVNLGALSAEAFLTQYESCVADFDIAAIKIGLIPDRHIADCIVKIVERHQVPVILDPVLAASSGGLSIEPEVSEIIRKQLLGKITLLTPNLPELGRLSAEVQPMELAAQQLLNEGLAACLVKGGHAETAFATDYFSSAQTTFYVYQPRLKNQVRGTGCVLASSIASQLALGHDLRDAIILAKAYLTRGIRDANQQGPYHLVTHHRHPLTISDIPRLCYRADLIGKHFDFPACPKNLGVYPVVDSADWVERLLTIGVKTIQLRIKDKATAKTRSEIFDAVATSQQHHEVSFFVNDHWQMAIEAGAYGVHLGQEDLHDANLLEIEQSGLRLGVSTHSYWELARALALNPSYIALGPVYPTTSKQMPWAPQGIERLQQWQSILADQYPLVAIGGIDVPRARILKQTGVNSVAMISAITQADDYQSVTRELVHLWADHHL
ncbi:phosphomethylpyrimidine kinase / Thiamin-phosphate pyrophosphorylase [Methylophaga lonarensis MPL]|uniref:Thiamine-phosphate synthase n=1 Tax=Methylophaga lonarensis MPL TaxID=1286106 RepID=M7P4F2_9GAMM|nr:thiamine phosphate synthase [Methylophaga lonarensis]EMR14381.1 phosphomethylpyrimidine kinase / Thiamin-phosphate pyrophosphorylase [Methylophaga lonarensis MPL]